MFSLCIFISSFNNIMQFLGHKFLSPPPGLFLNLFPLMLSQTGLLLISFLDWSLLVNSSVAEFFVCLAFAACSFPEMIYQFHRPLLLLQLVCVSTLEDHVIFKADAFFLFQVGGLYCLLSSNSAQDFRHYTKS